MAHYKEPDWFTRKVMHPAVMWLTARGVSVWGSRALEVPGRKTGEPRRTPVNLLDLAGHQYLVAPRGTTQWVRNVRANDGRLHLLLGRSRTEFQATELPDAAEKVDVLRAYLKKWKFEIGMFFDGVDGSSSDEAILAEAPKYPVFRVEPLAA